MTEQILSKLIRINRQWIKVCRNSLAPYQYIGVMHLIVIYVNKYPGSRQEDVASFYSLDKASVARDALRLEKMGHIKRQTDPLSRRQYCLCLTRQGKKMVDILRDIYVDFENRILSTLSEDEKEKLSGLLNQVNL